MCVTLRVAKNYKNKNKSNSKKDKKMSISVPRVHRLGPDAGFTDTSPLGYTISSSATYFDFQFANGVSTANVSATTLTQLLSSTGVLASFPANATPVSSAGSLQLYQKVRLTDALVSVSVIGSQSNTLASGDLYNRLRAILFWSGETYQGSQISPLSGNTVDQWPNMQDVETILGDWKFDLPTLAFNSTNYNVPMVRTWRGTVPINRTIECFNTSSSGTGAWETRKGDLVYAFVSDSSVTPNPTLIFTMRVFYHIVRS